MAMKYEIIAASPVFRPSGMMPYRIVLLGWMPKDSEQFGMFGTHKQWFNEQDAISTLSAGLPYSVFPNGIQRATDNFAGRVQSALDEHGQALVPGFRPGRFKYAVTGEGFGP